MKDIPPLYSHQKRIIEEDKARTGLWLGTGASKTRTALELAEGKILVVCPKQQREDRTWEKENNKWGKHHDITVLSKEDMRTKWQTLPYFDTVIIDECQFVAGVEPMYRQRKGKQIPKASQIFEACHSFLKKHPPSRLYLLSATPVSERKPMRLWALATLLGYKWDFEEFRRAFCFPINIGQRQVWVARKDEATKERLKRAIQKTGYCGSLNDFFDVPDQIHKEVVIELTKEQKHAIKELKSTEADPMVRRAKERVIENGVLYGHKIERVSDKEERVIPHTTLFPSKKIDYILERAEEFPKMLIFCNYTAQVHAVADALKKEGYKVSTLTGATKDRKTLIEAAENDSQHHIVAQCALSSGYGLPSFPCVIFASKNWQAEHYIQSLGRVQRSDNIKKNTYIHLISEGNGPDKDCHDVILSGSDFAEKAYSMHIDSDTA